MTGSVTYLDASAFVKTVLREPESDALGRVLGRRTILASSSLLRTEALRAVRHERAEYVRLAREHLDQVRLIAIDHRLLDMAGMLEPTIVRSLDALHIATALTVGDDLDVVVTYDDRMADGARSVGLPVVSPR